LSSDLRLSTSFACLVFFTSFWSKNKLTNDPNNSYGKSEKKYTPVSHSFTSTPPKKGPKDVPKYTTAVFIPKSLPLICGE